MANLKHDDYQVAAHGQARWGPWCRCRQWSRRAALLAATRVLMRQEQP